MKGELVSFRTSDGIELPGFYARAVHRNGKCAIFIHGLTGGFLDPKLVDALGESCLRAGFDFFAFNNRGSGMITGFDQKGKWVKVGGSLERFEDCAKDIRAALDFVQKRGCRKAVLMGHSTGCQKSAYYQTTKRDKRVAALVLLGPASDIDVMKAKLKKKYGGVLALAKRMVKASKGKQLMPNDSLSALRYYSLYKPTSVEGNIFNYATGKMPRLAKINVPVFAVYGSKDNYAVYGPKRELAMLKENVKTRYESTIIAGAGHNFERHERDVARAVGRFLNSLE